MKKIKVGLIGLGGWGKNIYRNLISLNCLEKVYDSNFHTIKKLKIENKKISTDLSEIFFACCDGKLNQLEIEWLDKKSLCIVVCSKGYPEDFDKHIEIENINKINLDDDEFIFHAGTAEENSKIYAVGGRVLNFVSLSKNLKSARKNIIHNIEKLNWSGGFYRKDIGFKVIDK